MSVLGPEVGDAYIEVHADTGPFGRELLARTKALAAAAGEDFGTQFGDRLNRSAFARMERFEKRLADAITSGDWKSLHRELGTTERLFDAVDEALSDMEVQGRITAKELEGVTGDFYAYLDKQRTAQQEKDQAAAEKALAEMQRAYDKRILASRNYYVKQDAASAEAAKREEARLQKAQEALERAYAQRVIASENYHVKREAAEKAAAERDEERLRKAQEALERAYSRRVLASENYHVKREAAERAAAAREVEVEREKEARKEQVRNDALTRYWISVQRNREAILSLDQDTLRRFEIDVDRALSRIEDANTRTFLRTTQNAYAILNMNREASVRYADQIDAALRRIYATTDARTQTLIRRNRADIATLARDTDAEYRGVFGRLAKSRNDFVHALGVLFGTFEVLSFRMSNRIFGRLGDGLSSLGERLIEMGDGSGPVAGIGKMLDSIGTAAAGGLNSVIGLAIALGVFIQTAALLNAAVSVAAAGLSMLVGIVTALAGVIVSGLLGALASLLPMLLALAPAIGAVVIAATSMTDEMKESVKPVTDWFEEVRTAVAQNLFGRLGEQIEALMPTIRELGGPLLLNTASALSRVIDDIVTRITSPGMQSALAVLGETLPRIVEAGGSAFTSLAAGAVAFAAAISPQVADIVERIADALSRWADWASSPEGQTELAAWFDRAWASAEKLWTILTLVWDILGDIFALGDESGQSGLDWLIQKLQELSEWVNSPEGRAELLQWFEDAKRLGGELSEALGDLADWFDEMDTEQAREAFIRLVEGVQMFLNIMGMIGTFIGPVVNIIMALALAVTVVADYFLIGADMILGALQTIVAQSTVSVASFLQNLSTLAQGIADVLRPIAPDMAAAFDAVAISLDGMSQWAIDAGAKTIEKIQEVRDKIADARDHVHRQQDDIKGFIDQWNELGKAEASPKIDIKGGQEAKDTLDKTKGLVTDLGSSSAMVPVGLNDAASVPLESVKSSMRMLMSMVATPTANLNDNVSKEAQKAQAALVTLGNTKVSPSATLVDNTSKQAEKARAAVLLVGTTHAHPSATLVDNASGVAARITSAINSIPNRTVTVTVRTVQQTVQAATGGYFPSGAVYGPGHSTQDYIPARLSPGEFVLNASAVRHYGPEMLHAMNERRLAGGGPTDGDLAAGGSPGIGGRVINVEAGAITVTGPVQNPETAASMVLERLFDSVEV